MNRLLDRLARNADRRPLEVSTPLGALGFDPERGPYGDARLVRAFKEASVSGEVMEFSPGVSIPVYAPSDAASRKPENAYAGVLKAAWNCGVAPGDVVVTSAPLSIAVFERKLASMAR